MRKLLLFLALTAAITSYAQESPVSTMNGALRLGAGYVHDFPGLNGLGVYTEYTLPMSNWLQGGIGVKRIMASGYPRTSTIKEHTNATTLDFNLLFVPYTDAVQAIKIGGGYTFAFYNTRRSYPVYNTNANLPQSKEPTWVMEDAKGRVSGFSFLAEYEYYLENNLSFGVRFTVAKAADPIWMAGPFAAFRF